MKLKNDQGDSWWGWGAPGYPDFFHISVWWRTRALEWTTVNSAINNDCELRVFDCTWLSLNCNSAISSTSALWETARGAAGLRGEDHRREQWPHTAGAESEQRRSECLGREHRRRLPLRRHHPLQRASQVSSELHCSSFSLPILSRSSISRIQCTACLWMLRKNPITTTTLSRQGNVLLVPPVCLILTALKMRFKPNEAFFFWGSVIHSKFQFG